MSDESNNNNNNTSICKAHNVSIRAESEAPDFVSSISLLMTDDGDYVMMAGEKQRRRDFRASLELPGKNLTFFRCHFVIISITP